MQLVAKTQTTALGTSTSETTIVTADPNFRNHLTGLIISSSNTAAASTVTVREATGGATRLLFSCPTGAVLQPTLALSFEPPLEQYAPANNNWTIQVSPNAVGTNVTATFITEQ